MYMHIVTVIPFSKSVRKESLTYFTAKDIAIGMIVTVTVRTKKIRGMVTAIANISDNKEEIKSASFNLKKIEKIHGSFSNKNFFSAARELEAYYLTPENSVLQALLPRAILDYGDELMHATETQESAGTNLKQEKLVFQAPFEDRLSWYKTFIRESFARKRSVFVMLPTIHDINLFREALGKGIENYTYAFHSEKSKKEMIADYRKSIDEAHPILIIGTAPFLSIPRSDMGALIIEHESSNAYRLINAPNYDLRIFAEAWSRTAGIKLIVGDTLLRVETMWRHESGEYGDVASPTFRIGKNSAREIIPTNRVEDETGKKKKFHALSPRAREVLAELQEKKGHIFLFTLRNGLATTTICRDCSTTLSCEYCNTPLTLYKNSRNPGSRIFICNRCKNHTPADSVCGTCASWNLIPYGIGIDSVHEELSHDFPDLAVFRIDRETVKTPKQGQKIAEQFYKSDRAILLGTEMAFSYLDEKVDDTTIVSFDSLFNIPSFRITERILQLLILLTGRTENTLFIQTQNPKEEILSISMESNLLSWYRTEIAERKRFNYPPFSTIIKATTSDTIQALAAEREKLNEIFGEYEPDIFLGTQTANKTDLLLHMVIRIPKSRWSLPALAPNGTIDPILREKLASISQKYAILIDPENLL